MVLIEKSGGDVFMMDPSVMPCGPNELAIPRYVLPDTYGRKEQEEAAARFIVACQEVGDWCGVAVQRLLAIARQDYEAWVAADQAKERALGHNFCEQWRFNYEVRYYKVYCILTLGLYWLFGKKPIRPYLLDVPIQVNLPFSGIYLFGSQHVMTGIIELVDKGMFTVERTDDGRVVIFPTPKLLEPIERNGLFSIQQPSRPPDHAT